MESGGEIGELLNKIAINIQETRIRKKEMAASVMTYAIFIGFAVFTGLTVFTVLPVFTVFTVFTVFSVLEY